MPTILLMMQRKLYEREGLKVYPTKLTKFELECQYSTLSLIYAHFCLRLKGSLGLMQKIARKSMSGTN